MTSHCTLYVLNKTEEYVADVRVDALAGARLAAIGPRLVVAS